MHKISDFLKSTAYLYLYLCIVFIPLNYFILPFQKSISNFLFGRIIQWVAVSVFNIPFRFTEISSDSASLYLLLLLLFVLAVLISFLLIFYQKWKARREQVYQILQRIFCYFLSLQLLKYGFDKIFKAQFYLPEPNTLYTPLGHLSKDILFWSTIGTSYSYNVIMGLAEIIPAILILFKRTRTIGLLWTIVVLLNIVAINFSFDISVKLYSLFLLFIALTLLLPQLGQLYQFFILEKIVTLRQKTNTLISSVFLKTFLKTFVIGIIFLEALYPYIKSGVYNDDNAERPYLHGAYEVQEVYTDDDTLKAASSPVKRFFIHRQGYLIFQAQSDEMKDHRIYIDYEMNNIAVYGDHTTKSFIIPYEYSPADSILKLKYPGADHTYTMKGKALNWKKLPALQNDFHWTIDQVY